MHDIYITRIRQNGYYSVLKPISTCETEDGKDDINTITIKYYYYNTLNGPNQFYKLITGNDFLSKHHHFCDRKLHYGFKHSLKAGPL